MYFRLKIFFLLVLILKCLLVNAQSPIIQLEFPLPIDSIHFKENKLKRIKLRYTNYYSDQNNHVSKSKNEMQIKYFVNENRILKLIGIIDALNNHSFDFSIPECERVKHDSNFSNGNAPDSGKIDSTKIYYTGKRIYRVDLLNTKNQLTGMYLYTYNDYKTLKKIFFYQLDCKNDLFLAEKIVLSYH